MTLSPTLQLSRTLALCAGLVAPAIAQNLTQFQNGQVADANAVNANFNGLKTAVQAADSSATMAQSSASAAAATAAGAQTAAANAQATADGAQATATAAQVAAANAQTTADSAQIAVTTLSGSLAPLTAAVAALPDGRVQIGAPPPVFAPQLFVKIGTPNTNKMFEAVSDQAGQAAFFQIAGYPFFGDADPAIGNRQLVASLRGNDDTVGALLRFGDANFVDIGRTSPGGFHVTTSSGQTRMVITPGGDMGIGTTVPLAKLHVSGSIHVEGGSSDFSVPYGEAIQFGHWDGSTFAELFRVTSSGNCTNLGGGYTQASDGRLKQEVQPLRGSLQKVLALQGVTYRWKDATWRERQPGTQIGFIAQDMADVVPELVVTDPDDGMLSVAYGGLTPVLVEAIKEQHAEITALRTENDDLRQRLATLEAAVAELQPLLAARK